MAADLTAGRVTSVGIVTAAPARIGAEDARIHAFITVDPEGALASARDSYARRAAGHTLVLLDGIPVALKDNIDVRAMPTTDGTAFFAARVAQADSEVAARLRAARAIILGKLNMHEGALGATTDNPFWGRCDNPALPGHTPGGSSGGSSGGSAAAVAAGFVPIAIGTDTMGSVRIPAAYAGHWGLKPTPGRVPTGGCSSCRPPSTPSARLPERPRTCAAFSRC
jgi:aspartyl-tRNA(Asn)/glutamyl-tRNA(Gln) amidotransferase subunit A